MRTLYAFILITLTVLSCRPASMDNYLYNASTDQVQIKVTDHDNRVILAGPEKQKITTLKKLATASEQKGSFKPDGTKYVSLHNGSNQLKYEIEIGLDKKNCKETTTGGTHLTNGTIFSVGCVSGTDLTDQIKAACKELSADKTIAEFNETATSCKCLRRQNPDLKYADYVGRVTAFTTDCKNSATSEQLKAICADIKDKYCPTCVVENLTCECPTKKTLMYSQYLTNVEGFHKECIDKKPDQNSTDSTTVFMGPMSPEDSLEKDCKEFKGEFRKQQGSAPVCVCVENVGIFPIEVTITVEEYRKDGRTLVENMCTPSL